MDDFYQPEIPSTSVLQGDEFKHCIKVLRKKSGDQIGIFDGQGQYFKVKIGAIAKNHCDLEILEKEILPRKPFYTHLVVAPTKSTDRMEWMIEKLGELSIDEVTFIHTQHAERPKIKTDRLEKKAISAMKQAKSGYLLKINPLIRFNEFIKSTQLSDNRYLATVKHGLPLLQRRLTQGSSATILIGPEGDFSENEINLASSQGFELISLGKTTLRTETAGLMACHIVNVVNDY